MQKILSLFGARDADGQGAAKRWADSVAKRPTSAVEDEEASRSIEWTPDRAVG